MFGVPVLLHIAFVERAPRVQEHAHVVVRVILPPDTYSCCSVQPEMFPGTPQRFYAGERFGVEVPLDAPFRGAARPSTSRT